MSAIGTYRIGNPGIRWTRLQCGHWILFDARWQTEPDGCVRCRKLHMIDEHDLRR